MVPFILYELSNGFLNFLHRAFKESHANLIILGDVTHTLRSIFGVVRKCKRPPSPGSGNQISTDTPIKAMLFESIESSNSSIPPYQSTPQLYHKSHILSTSNFNFAHLYFNQLTATSNGLEVEILFNEINLGIQSHATFCPYKIQYSLHSLAHRS